MQKQADFLKAADISYKGQKVALVCPSVIDTSEASFQTLSLMSYSA